MNKKSVGCGGAAGFSVLCLLIRIIAKLWAFQGTGPPPTITPVIQPSEEWLRCETSVIEGLEAIMDAWKSLVEAGDDTHFCIQADILHELLATHRRDHQGCGKPTQATLESLHNEIDCVFESWLGASTSVQRYCSSEQLVFLDVGDAAYREGVRCIKEAARLLGEPP